MTAIQTRLLGISIPSTLTQGSLALPLPRSMSSAGPLGNLDRERLVLRVTADNANLGQYREWLCQEEGRGCVRACSVREGQSRQLSDLGGIVDERMREKRSYVAAKVAHTMF